jgi:tetratricopeptide (TPR) repeat protein
VEAKHAAWLNGVMARVERAASAQNWDEALSALNEALRLEPDNAEMQARAAQVREMRRVAELNARLQRADQAVEAGRWDEAIDILNDGLASDPENKTLKTKLAEARKAKREARLQAALRLAESAAGAGKWEAAIASLNEVLANEPDNIEFQKKLAEVRARERQSQWQAARTQSEGLREAERFAEALQVWRDYLSIHPEDREQVEKETKPIAQERELFDLYTSAEESMAARDFDPAIRSLKEIILRDENYKDASRLLTKAIESRRTGNTQRLGKPRKKPASPKPARAPKTGGKRTWVIGGLAAILILGIGGGLFWLGKNGLPAAPAPTSTGTRAAPTLTPTPALDPDLQAALDTTQSEEPLYQTSFDDWDTDDTGRNAALVNGKLILTSEDENGATLSLNPYPSDSFAVEFELSISGDSSPDGHCVYEAGNGAPQGDESRVFSAEFHPGEDLAVLSTYVHQLRGHQRIVTTPFDKTISNAVTLVVLGDQITTFINGQLAYTAQDPAGSAVYLYHGLSAYNQVTCGFDHFKYWDLREMDSAIKSALATIQSEEPLYQTSFDAWESWDSHGTTKVENGKLIVASENQQHAGVNLYNLISDKYAVQFDLRVLDISSLGHCIFETSNDADSGTSAWRAVSAGFFSDGHATLARYIHPDRFEDFEGAIGEYDLAKSNTVTLIILGDQIAAFVDGNLAYTVLDPDGSAVFTSQALSANYTAQCEYDNFKIWDLSGVDFSASTESPDNSPSASTESWVTDFAEPILSAISKQSPAIDDNLDSNLGGWNQPTWCHSSKMKFENGEVIFSCSEVTRRNMAYKDFVLEFDIRLVEDTGEPYARLEVNHLQSHNFVLYPSGELSVKVSRQGEERFNIDKTISSFEKNRIQIIAKENRYAFYVNGEPVLYFEDNYYYSREPIQFHAGGLLVALDNLKIWDLEKVPNLP